MIPFLDLKAQYAQIRSEVLVAIEEVLDSCQFTLGSKVESFEQDFAEYSQSRFGVGVNSGTSALHLALLAAGVGPGDEVITIPFTFVATVSAIGYTGATPVFVDVDPVSRTMNPDLLEAAITPNTKAILPVHLHGQMADMDPIVAIARKHGLVVIEDAAQAHGAEYKGRRAGSIGDLGCFSFYPGKNLGAYGEAGLVTTNSEALNEKVRILRDWGAKTKYQHIVKGYNYRMEGIQGAVLSVKLKYLEEWTEGRRRVAKRYGELLADSGIQLPQESPDNRHVWHVYACQSPDRADLQARLSDAGIQTGIHYPVPVHLQPAWRELGHKPGDFPVSEHLADQVLSLPMFPEMTDRQIEAVCAEVAGFAGRSLSKAS